SRSFESDRPAGAVKLCRRGVTVWFAAARPFSPNRNGARRPSSDDRRHSPCWICRWLRGRGAEMVMGRGRIGGVVGAAAVVALVGLGACGGGGGGGGGAGAGNTSPTGGGGVPGGNLSQRPAPAFALFDDTRVHDISLTMSANDWQSIIQDSSG